MLAVSLPITSTPLVLLKSLRGKTPFLLEDSFPQLGLTHRGSFSGHPKPGMEFGMKIHLNLNPTNVHSPNYCTTKWAEDTEPQGAWLEGEPAKWDGRQRDSRDGAVSPFRNEAAGDTQSLCQGAQVLPEAPEPAPPTQRQNIVSHDTAQHWELPAMGLCPLSHIPRTRRGERSCKERDGNG